MFESNPLLKRSVEFSLEVIAFCEQLEADRKFIIARQLLKSGTSIGANSMEAQRAESKADFIHKIKIAAKETEETQYWLLLCQYSPQYPEAKPLLENLEQIQKIISGILATARKRNPFSYLLSCFFF